MTQQEERNLIYAQDSTKQAGFGELYYKVIEDGFKAGLKEIPLDEYIRPISDTRVIVFEPKVTQGRQEGRYNFNGYQATVLAAGHEPVTQFIPNFKMSGMTVDNAHVALMGGTTLHSEWDNKNNERRFVFSKFDMSQPVKEGENYPVIRINAKDLELLRLLGREDIVGTQSEKERYLAILQTGERFEVNVREKISGSSTYRYPKVWLQLDMQDDKRMGMRVTDGDGVELRPPHVIQVRERDLLKSQDMLIGDEGRSKLSEGQQKMLEMLKSGRSGENNLKAVPAGEGEMTKKTDKGKGTSKGFHRA